MILSLQAFAPAALLLLGGLVLLLRPSATLFVVLQLAVLAVLLRLSQLSAGTLSVAVYEPLPDLPLILRLDRLSLFFATTAVSAALLLSLPLIGRRRDDVPLGWLALAEFGAMLAMLAGNLQGLAVGWGGYVAALLMLVVVPRPLAGGLRRPSATVTRNLVLQLAGAALLVVGGVAVDALAGTANYDAIPVGAVDSRTGLLLAGAPLVALATLSGLVRACRRPLVAALLLTSAALPLAAYVLARTFDLSEGRPLNGSVAAVLVGLGGAGALLFGTYALWAPDLGATIARLLNALALLVVAAFGVAGAGGLVALLVGFIALEVVAGAALVLLEAGRGRLPGAGFLPRWALGMLAVLPLAAAGGLGLGLSLDARILLPRLVADEGAAGVAGAALVAVASLAILAGAFAAGRFGGGRVESRRDVAHLGLGAASLVGVALAAPAIVDLTIALSAAAARAPLADVRSVVLALVPGPLFGIGLLAGVLALAALAAGPGRGYSSRDGVLGAPDLLPPRTAVVAEIVLRSLLGAVARRGAAVAGFVARHGRWAVATAWLAGGLVLLLAAR